MCTLAGTTKLTDEARQLSSSRSSPRNAGLFKSGTGSTSPTSPTQQMMGVYEPISELVCTSSGGPCFGENGEIGFSIREGQGNKTRYWATETTASMPSLNAQYSSADQTIHQCAKVGLRSFSPLDSQACPATDFGMPSIAEKTCTAADFAIPYPNAFEFPSWDQLPEDLQNPTTSADFCSTIPISATEGGSELMAWENEDMNFAMDMDMDMDMDLDLDLNLGMDGFGKC
jgi:hypothetical protein